MNKNLLVEIFADFGAEDGKGKASTGYPIAKDRILTARHGLYDENGFLASKIEVRWYYQRDQEGCNWQVAEVVDCGLDERLDVALLQCSFPEQTHSSIRFIFENPHEDFDWESDGFAAAGKRDELRPPIPLAGEAYHVADGENWLHLTEKGKAEAPELWKGISGAPVFRKNSNELMGVIVECPDNFDAIRLYATPLWKLADNSQFRNEIAKARERDLQQIRRDLDVIFKDAPKLLETFAIKFGCSKDALIDRLINTHTNELLKHCEQVVSKLKREQAQAEISKGKALVNYLLPVVFDQYTIDAVCSQSKFGVCRVDVGTRTVAEIIMAGKDGRATKYKPLEQEGDPAGEYLLDSPALNQGIGDDNWVANFKDQIIKDFARLDELAVGQNQELEFSEKLALAVDELEYRVEDKRTCYYLYRTPKNAVDSDERAKAIDQLRQALNGHVVFIECGGADIIRNERRNINRPLAKILQNEIEETP